MQPSWTYSRMRASWRAGHVHTRCGTPSSSTAALTAEAGQPGNARMGCAERLAGGRDDGLAGALQVWLMACDRTLVGWGVTAEGGLHTSFVSERCCAWTPGRDVKSASGRSVDVCDSMEDRVSVDWSISILRGD